MKRLKLIRNDSFDYASDVERIIEVCANNDYEIDFETAKAAWQLYSDSMCAGWLCLDDDSIFRNIQPYLEEE
jgi:hypothetical protein